MEMKDKSQIIAGLHYGEHHFDPESLIKNVETFGEGSTFAMIRPVPYANMPLTSTEEDYYEWARYFAEKKIYFCFLYTQSVAPEGQDSILNPEIVKNIYDIAGEYFLGDSLGEIGNCYIMSNETKGNFEDLRDAKVDCIAAIKHHVDVNKSLGIKISSPVESHMVMRYDLEAGMNIINAELFPANPEISLSFTRGATRGYGKEDFGGYIAHEWYAGMRNEDPLKMKRLHLMYYETYMAGASQVILESGFETIKSYGSDFDSNHPLCKETAKEARDFHTFIKKDKRLAHGPLVKVAFVGGNLDSYGGDPLGQGGVCPSAAWGQHKQEACAYGSPEQSYRILDEVYRSCDWQYHINYGDADYSHAPAYGQYDVLPSEASVEVMSRYDWLIFTGWNTMTEELYGKLKAYVEAGGHLLISAAHMRTTTVRSEKGHYLFDGNFSDLLGLELTGSTIRSKDGFKFERESIIDGLLYPGSPDYRCDPIASLGYTDYAEVKLTTGRRAAFFAKRFPNEGYENSPAVLVENSCGKGKTLFMCTEEYPGSPDVYTLYRILVKSILTATHRDCDIKVICNDKVRFAVYEDDTYYKVYLLNTDMNFEQKTRVIYKDQVFEKTVASIGFDSVLFEK